MSISFQRDYADHGTFYCNEDAYGIYNHPTPKKGRNSLHRAVAARRFDIVERIVRILSEAPFSINDRDYQGKTALHTATKNRDLKCVKLLVQAGADPEIKNGKGITPRQIANRKILDYFNFPNESACQKISRIGLFQWLLQCLDKE